ncbi:MAG: glycosyltransferase family 39 protein, partial [Candidatus Obscuribacterales bacterium]|nr:glycosyltransferase family 39 protein [Candidatus Obscuribacterales bacterium]
GMSTFGVTDPGEGYYVEAAREMVESGDFITPHLNYQIYFSKPILTFWLMAIPYKIFGVSEFSARIAFSFIASLLVFSTYFVGRSFKSEFAGLFAGLVIASSPLIIAVTRLSPIDIAFTCFVDLTVFSFAMCALLDRKRWWWVFHAALGLAVLTKGPAGVILFLFGTIAFLVLARPPIAHMKVWFHRLRPALGAVIFWAIVLPWYVAIDAATKGLFLLVFFFYENFARFAGHTNLGKSTWWYYLPVIGYGFAPWIVLLPFAGFGILKSGLTLKTTTVSQSAQSSVLDPQTTEANSRSTKQLFLFYLFIWALSEFLFFSCSKTKMDTYILPSFAPFAVCVAIKVEEWLSTLESSGAETKSRGWASVLSLLAAILGFGILVAGPIAAFIFVKTELIGKLAIAAGAACLALGLIFYSRLYKAGKIEQAVAAFACGFALAGALCQPIGFQLGSKKRWDNLKLLSEHLNGKDVNIAIFNTFKPAAMFYSRNSVDSFFHPHQLEKVGVQTRRQLVICNDKVVDRLITQPGLQLKLVERSGEWAVYEAVGAKLRRNLTLEEVFTKPQAFEMAISGKGDWGPLTVPYAAGDREWWKKK